MPYIEIVNKICYNKYRKEREVGNMRTKITPEIVEQINELLKEKTQKEVADMLRNISKLHIPPRKKDYRSA